MLGCAVQKKMPPVLGAGMRGLNACHDVPAAFGCRVRLADDGGIENASDFPEVCMRVFLPLAATLSLGLLSSGPPMAAQGRGSVTITRLVPGPDGKAQALNLPVAFHPSLLRAGLDESTAVKVSGAQFVRWPRGYVWPSYTAATKQFVITISGRVAPGMLGASSEPRRNRGT
jgi:hypothetical protein